jgi:START domain-containing protein
VILALVLAASSAAIPPNLPFQPWFKSRGVQVEIARVPGSAPWLRATAELPVPAEKVTAILTDFRHYRDLFAPAIKKAEILEGLDSGARIHFVWPYPFPLRNRDAIVVYRGQTLEDGRFVLTWKEDARPGDPHEGVRVEHVAGETVVEPLGPDRCRVTYTYLGELGGKFPAWAEDKAWREEPVQYIRALRRRLNLPDIR